ELVDEDVRGPEAVGGHGAVEVEDAAAAVGVAVDEDLDELVRRIGGDVPEGAVVEGEDVALAAEGVIGGADGRAAVLPGGGPGDAGLGGGRHQAPDVEV